MDKNMLGGLICYERERKEIDIKMLARDICSPVAIQRLETADRTPDYFVLERILERLGKSLNKIEFLYDEKVYEIFYLRGMLEYYLEEKDYAEVLDALAYYESIPEGQEPLHKQYIYKIRAIVLSERDENHKEAARMYERALAETVSDFDLDNIECFLLGEEELTLVFLWIKERWLQKDVSLRLNPEKLFAYIERYCEDEEIKINIYTKAAWLIGTFYMEQGEYREALRYTLKGQDVLAENGILLHMPEFLERILTLTKQCGEAAYDTWKRQRDALKSLYEEYEKPWAEETMALWKGFRQQERYLYSEVFAQERKRRKMSQEKLADALEIDQKTISRIESGRFKPKTGTLKKLREYLQVERDVCTTRIVVDDFKLLEMEREIAKLTSDGGEEEAERLFLELKPRLSLKWKENQQYIKLQEAMYDNRLRNVSFEKTMQICMDAFHITRPNADISEIDQMVLSRMEVIVLDYIAICYFRMNSKSKAVEILENIVKGYERSKVDLKHYYASLCLVYTNLAGWCESMERYEEALMWCEREICLELECKRGLNIGYILAQRCYTLERCGKMYEEAKEIYKKAYQILKLMHRKKKMKSLCRMYYKWYKEEIDK